MISITKLKKIYIMSNQSFFYYKIIHIPKIFAKECFLKEYFTTYFVY
jgi:hypothetical protein